MGVVSTGQNKWTWSHSAEYILTTRSACKARQGLDRFYCSTDNTFVKDVHEHVMLI